MRKIIMIKVILVIFGVANLTLTHNMVGTINPIQPYKRQSFREMFHEICKIEFAKSIIFTHLLLLERISAGELLKLCVNLIIFAEIDHSSQTVPLVAHEIVPLQRSADGVVNPRADGTIF